MDTLLAEASAHVTEFRAHLIAADEEPLEIAKAALAVQVSGVGPGHGTDRWDAVAKASGGDFKGFNDLISRTATTLQGVKKNELITMVRAVHKAHDYSMAIANPWALLEASASPSMVSFK